jgi:hypothetical protein
LWNYFRLNLDQQIRKADTEVSTHEQVLGPQGHPAYKFALTCFGQGLGNAGLCAKSNLMRQRGTNPLPRSISQYRFDPTRSWFDHLVPRTIAIKMSSDGPAGHVSELKQFIRSKTAKLHLSCRLLSDTAAIRNPGSIANRKKASHRFGCELLLSNLNSFV